MARSLKNLKKSKRKNKGSQKGESSSVPSAPAKEWQPGVDGLEEGEELQFDPSAYNYLRGFNFGWPCCLLEAEKAEWNYIGIFKLSNITGKKRELMPTAVYNDTEMDSDSSSDEDEDDAGDESVQPILQLHKVGHQGCVNHIRSMAQKPHICATWADTGHVQEWDCSSSLNALAESETDVRRGDNKIHHQSPIIKFGGHKNEGYAIDRSPVVPGRLVSVMNLHQWKEKAYLYYFPKGPFICGSRHQKHGMQM